MTKSHNSSSKPSSFLALICLAIVARYNRRWLAISVTTAAQSEGVNPQTLSRQATRAVAPFAKQVESLRRIGRPLADLASSALRIEVNLLCALLSLATTLLQQCSYRCATMRQLIVGAFLRLQVEYPQLTQQRFCNTIALPVRTLRHWLAQAKALGPSNPPTTLPAEQTTSAPSPKRRRPPRRGHFGFAVTLPDTQLAADTTDLKAFGVPLKLMATQDIGGRDQDLFDQVIVDDHESAQHIAQLWENSLAQTPGLQAITDQGTPYLAELTQQTLIELEADHAPQKEGDPLGKATLERAFGTIKTIARPILQLTNRLAQKIPQLARADLAKPVTKLLLVALLRAYQAGARAHHRACVARGGMDPDQLVQAAEISRSQARAEQRSKRLLLKEIYNTLGPGDGMAQDKFVATFRRFPLPVLHRAALAFGTQAHRSDIRKRDRYFAKIVYVKNNEYVAEKQWDTASHENLKELEKARAQAEHTHEAALNEPAYGLQQALTNIAALWQPPARSLFCGGAGLGKGQLREILRHVHATLGPEATRDLATAALRQFETHNKNDLGADGITAVRTVLDQCLAALSLPATGPTSGPAAAADHDTYLPHTEENRPGNIAQRFAAAILCSSGQKPRPPPHRDLRT